MTQEEPVLTQQAPFIQNPPLGLRIMSRHAKDVITDNGRTTRKHNALSAYTVVGGGVDHSSARE